jgi:protein-disulfide isomerase
MTSLPARAASDLKLAATNPLAVALAVLFLASTVSLVAFFPREGRSVIDASAAPAAADAAAAQGQPSEFERYYTSLPRMSLVVPNEGAKVLIVKFNDYQCPACGKTHTEYKSVLAKYEASNPGAVKLVTKDYPIESECNNNTTSNLHPASCEAAVAVRLAREHNRAEALEDWLVENQARLTPQLVREGARTVGQVADFDARYPVILEQVKADIAYGRQLGVNATPTFFVNGVRIPGGLHPAHFDQAIAYELARAK